MTKIIIFIIIPVYSENIQNNNISDNNYNKESKSEK